MRRLPPEPASSFAHSPIGFGGGALPRVLAGLGRARSREEVGAFFVDGVRDVVGADALAMYLLPRPKQQGTAFSAGVREQTLLAYESSGRQMDDILRAAVRTCTPVHERLVLGVDRWHAHPLYREIARQFPIEYYLLAPILSSGKVIGTLNLGRRASRREFSFRDLVAMGIVAGQISVSLDRIGRPGSRPPSPDCLTARENEVAWLVAKGCTNAEIGRALFISTNGVKQSLKRIFGKLEISTRAELAAAMAASS